MWRKEEQRNGLKILNAQNLANGLNFFVSFVKMKAKISHLTIKEKNGTIAPENVTQMIGKKIGNQKNNQVGVGELLLMNHIGVGLKRTQNEWRISGLVDMPAKEMRKVHTLWGNGMNFVRSMIGDARNVIKEGNLLKTTLNRCLEVVVITYQTFNRFVGRVIVGSGSFTFTKTLNY